MDCIDTNSTKIFLNAFGLVLQDGDERKLDIYDGDDTNVGYIDKNFYETTIINNMGSCQLLATNIPHIQAHGRRNRVVVKSNVIKFNIVEAGSDQSVNRPLVGFMRINAYKTQQLSTEYGASFNATYRDSNGRIVTFSMNEGNILRISITDANSEEIIEINQTSYCHIHHKGDYSERLNAHPYCKEVTITHDDKTRFKMKKTVIIEGKVRLIDSKDEELPLPVCKNADFSEFYNGLMKQTVQLIHDEDAFVARKIASIKDALSEYNGLFENLISLCYENYSDELINKLFGVERKSFYQCGALNLADACKGIKSNPVKVNSIGQK